MNLICCGFILLSLVGLASAESRAATFGAAFMDINPDRGEVGFYQIFAVSTNVSTVTIQSLRELSNVEQLNGPLGKFYNSTQNWNELTVVSATKPGERTEERYGITVNADAGSDVHVYGVKSDKGTTDSFMALPLTENSNEFIIASWNCSHAEFFAAFQVAAPLEDTCVEIWAVDGDNYEHKVGLYMRHAYDTFTYTADSPGSGITEITGYFVNSSKPINVYGGHACAFVPEGTFFCDHIVEQIPPVSELGKMHIVPPIIGRNTNAGYVVRVVSAYINTTVDWESEDSKTKGSQVVTRGHFVQFQNPLAAQAMKVDCDKPCLVMLYNTGRNAVPGDQSDTVPSDPFMMHIAPIDHYDTTAGFATPSFSGTIDGDQVRLHFSDQLTIITKTDDTAAIMFDGQAVTTQTQWRKASNWRYSYAAFPVTHGAHFITVTQGSAATFGAYAYGHSLIDTSSSAYGMTVGFQVAGKLYGDLWEKTRQELMQKEETLLASDCKQERILSGSAVAQYPSAASPLVMTHPIELGVTVNSGPMSGACREQYMLALTADLKDRSRLINEMICNGSMCPYMSGAPGSGIPVNQSAILTKHVVFVAIDTASLIDPVSFDVDSTGGITTVYVKVPYTGIMDTTTETFAKCRVEVREFLRPFVNWRHGTATAPLLTPSGCPQITFTAPFQFSKRPSICSLP